MAMAGWLLREYSPSYGPSGTWAMRDRGEERAPKGEVSLEGNRALTEEEDKECLKRRWRTCDEPWLLEGTDRIGMEMGTEGDGQSFTSTGDKE